MEFPMLGHYCYTCIINYLRTCYYLCFDEHCIFFPLITNIQSLTCQNILCCHDDKPFHINISEYHCTISVLLVCPIHSLPESCNAGDRPSDFGLME